MFQREKDGTHIYIGTPDLTQYQNEVLPGVYAYKRTPMGWKLVPQVSASDKYIEIPNPAMDLVREELSEFFDSEVAARVKAAGYVNKRGILMYGPAGTGKTRMMTRTVEQMAVVNDAVVLVGIDPDGDLESAITGIRAHTPDRPIIVMWDEFETTVGRFEHELLRWLDGVTSVDNILFIACMNNIKEVPSRIYSRPSRFSLVVEFGNLSDEARMAYLDGLWPDGDKGIKRGIVRLGRNKSLDFTKELAFLAFVRGKSIEQIEQRLELLKLMGANFDAEGNAPPLPKVRVTTTTTTSSNPNT